MDDGKTMAYTRGEFLRVNFSCEITQQGVSLHIGEHQGPFRPWWSQIHVEIYGWDSSTGHVRFKTGPNPLDASIDGSKHVLAFDLKDEGHGTDLEIRNSN